MFHRSKWEGKSCDKIEEYNSGSWCYVAQIAPLKVISGRMGSIILTLPQTYLSADFLAFCWFCRFCWCFPMLQSTTFFQCPANVFSSDKSLLALQCCNSYMISQLSYIWAAKSQGWKWMGGDGFGLGISVWTDSIEHHFDQILNTVLTRWEVVNVIVPKGINFGIFRRSW